MSRSEDTEITLGAGKMLTLFFILVALCAVFFGVGFKLGKGSVVAAAVDSASATAPAGGPRPSAAKTNASPPETPASQPSQKDDNPAPPSDPAAMPSSGGYFVQVAAVSKQEDAEALVDALKKKQYPALTAASSDRLFHVQVGPFADIKEAEASRSKLISDGYNPILKK